MKFFHNKLQIVTFGMMIVCLVMMFYSANQGKAFEWNGGSGFAVLLLIATIEWIYSY